VASPDEGDAVEKPATGLISQGEPQFLFTESVGPEPLNKSCLGCHGPMCQKADFAVDELILTC